jgi:hypothetical protein
MTKVSELFPVSAALEILAADLRRNSIDLTADDMRKGRRIRDEVTGAVRALPRSTQSFPQMSEPAFVGGSFGRRTQAKPFDDLDLFFPLDGAHLQMRSPALHPTDEELVGSAPSGVVADDTQLHTLGWVDSAKVLNLICSELPRLTLAPLENSPQRNRRGRCAHLTYQGINVDLVFVLHAQCSDGSDRFYLPYGGSWHWKATNPKADQSRLTNANQANNGLLLSTIRTLKAWNDHACAGRLKSIHLEVMIQSMFTDLSIDSVLGATTFALQALPAALSTACSDPTGLGDNLDINLPDADRYWVQQAAADAAAQASRLNVLGQTDPTSAVNGWESLLLEDAPVPPARDKPERSPRHDECFGQPAPNHHGGSVIVPPPRAEDTRGRPADQRHRSGEYA